jgi:hypothetical protein
MLDCGKYILWNPELSKLVTVADFYQAATTAQEKDQSVRDLNTLEELLINK